MQIYFVGTFNLFSKGEQFFKVLLRPLKWQRPNWIVFNVPLTKYSFFLATLALSLVTRIQMLRRSVALVTTRAVLWRSFITCGHCHLPPDDCCLLMTVVWILKYSGLKEQASDPHWLHEVCVRRAAHWFGGPTFHFQIRVFIFIFSLTVEISS